MIYLAPEFVPSQKLDPALECVFAIRSIFTLSLSCIDFFIDEGGFSSLGRVLEKPWSDPAMKGALWLLKTISTHTQRLIDPKESSRIVHVLTKIFVKGVYQNCPNPDCLDPVEVQFQYPSHTSIPREDAISETQSNLPAGYSFSMIHVEKPRDGERSATMKTLSSGLHIEGLSAARTSPSAVNCHNPGSLEGYHTDSGFFSYGCVPDRAERSVFGSSSSSSGSSGASEWNQWNCSMAILRSLMQTLMALLNREGVNFIDFELQGGVEASINLMASCQVLIWGHWPPTQLHAPFHCTPVGSTAELLQCIKPHSNCQMELFWLLMLP